MQALFYKKWKTLYFRAIILAQEFCYERKVKAVGKK